MTHDVLSTLADVMHTMRRTGRAPTCQQLAEWECALRDAALDAWRMRRALDEMAADAWKDAQRPSVPAPVIVSLPKGWAVVEGART